MSNKPVDQDHLSAIIDRNISTLLEVRRQMDRAQSFQARFANAIAESFGDPVFVYIHAIWFLAWVLWNTGLLGMPIFDPFPFGLLTTIVSLEAIFLSMFVLISQNQLVRLSEQRSDLDLHINLLAEYEITKILRLVDAIADHLKLHEGRDPELRELEKVVEPQALLREIELQKLRILSISKRKADKLAV